MRTDERCHCGPFELRKYSETLLSHEDSFANSNLNVRGARFARSSIVLRVNFFINKWNRHMFNVRESSIPTSTMKKNRARWSGTVKKKAAFVRQPLPL